VALLVFLAAYLRIQDMPYPLMNYPSLLFVRCEIIGLCFAYCIESITENLSSLGLDYTNNMARDWLCGCETFVHVQMDRTTITRRFPGTCGVWGVGKSIGRA
jgi:hypothetical protein